MGRGEGMGDDEFSLGDGTYMVVIKPLKGVGYLNIKGREQVRAEDTFFLKSLAS